MLCPAEGEIHFAFLTQIHTDFVPVVVNKSEPISESPLDIVLKHRVTISRVTGDVKHSLYHRGRRVTLRKK